MKGFTNIYKLVDKNGKEVSRGTAFELAGLIDCSPVTIQNAGRPNVANTHSDYWLKKKHRVYKVGEKSKKKHIKKPIVDDKPLSTEEHLVLELVKRRKDQTISMEDPKPYFELLKQMGVNCTAKEVNDCDVMMRLKPVGRRRKQKTHYFVEVKERWTTEPSRLT